MAKHTLYDVAVSEVRGEATPQERAKLNADVFEWRDALQSVIDEVDAQFVIENDKFRDAVEGFYPDSPEYLEVSEHYEQWKGRVRVFKKHITARLMAVKRMCQEEADGGSSSDAVLRAAIRLYEVADSGDESWDPAYEALLTVVEGYLGSDA